MRTRSRHTLFRMIVTIAAFASAGLAAAPAFGAVTSVTPNTWNVIGLDSNRPATGPNRFPVGAKVCSDAAGVVPVTFTWDSINALVDLRPGSLGTAGNPLNLTFTAPGCMDAYFEAEVQKSSAAFNTSRRYYITAGTVSTPRPRELFIEKLVSQARNYITNVRLNGASVPAGGAMNLMVGETYTIELLGGTAPGGYEQFEAFINFPNTIFQVLSVSTTYSASPLSLYVSNPNPALYADACLWESDPNSPYYLSCLAGGKAGGSNVVTTYTVKIVSGGGSSQTLNTLLYDFSGSSFHYNADFSTGARFANIIDPTNVTIAKSFTPNPTNVGGVSTLTFMLTNPNAGAVTGLNFTDPFPAGMVVANPTNATTNGCGTPTFIPGAGAGSISFSNGTIAANSSCTIKVNVTAPATGTYNNTSGNLYVGALDTGKTASASLTVDTASFPPPPPPSTCSTPVTLASWSMPASGQGSGGPPPPYTTKQTDVATATASYTAAGGSTQAISSTEGSPAANSWSGTGGWAANNTGFPAATTAPFFDFTLDTSNYGGVRVSFNYALFGNGDWGNPGINYVYVYSSENGAAFSAVSTIGASKGNWYGSGIVAAASTGTNTTTFRINAVGANKASSAVHLDEIIFTGCPRVTYIPPTIVKSFSPNPVAVNGVSTLTFTLTNANAVQLTGAKFTDNLPAGLQVAAAPLASTTCTGSPTWAPAAGATILNFGQTTGANIPASGSCTVSVNVTATTAGPKENVSGFISAAETGAHTGSTGVATASLTAVLPPSIAKQFAPNPVLAGGVSTLTYAITNPNQNNSLSGIAFTDTFPLAPGAMVVAATPNATTNGCGAPVFAPAAGAGSVSFTGGTIAGGGTCYVTVNITAPANGTYNSTSGNVSHIINAATVNGNTANASLTVNPASPQIELLKQVGPSAAGPWTKYMPVTTGANVYYKFTVENPGDVDLSSVTVNDPAFGGLVAGCSWGTLAKYGDVTCAAGPIPAVSGSVLNTATASGTYSATVYTDQSSALYATTGLTFSKSATQTYFTAVGNVLNYSYLVTNSGFATLQGPVTVADNKTTVTCPALSTVGNLDNFFNADEVITCTATYTVTAADVTAKLVTNIASSTVDGVTSATAGKTVPLAADLTATKTNNVGGVVGINSPYTWTLTVANAATSGSTASFSDTQTLLTDNLPNSGATYVLGTVTKAGATGAINCSIASNNVNCTASGAVTLPPGLQGTIAVTNGTAAVAGTGTAFTIQLSAGSIIMINGVPYTVASIASDTALTLTANYTGITASGLAVPASFSVPVVVTPSTVGDLVNPRSGGICRADPGLVIPENAANNDCSNTVSVQLAPTIVKSFSPDVVPLGGTATLTITISNPAGAAALTSMGLTDTYPSNLVNAATPNATTTCSGGVATAAGGGSNVVLSGASLSADSSCTVTVSVTSSIAGAYVNTIAGGALSNDQAKTNLTPASATLTAGAPNIIVLKSVQAFSDPINGTTGPKSIPGSVMLYTILVTNSGAGAVDNNTTVVTDAIPANTILCVANACNNPPVAFTCSGTPPCGLSYDVATNVTYSNQVGGVAPYTYTPTPDADGFDAAVTGMRVNPTGVFNGESGGNNSSFSLTFKVKVR